jgi:periplasmic protein TonB
MMMTYAVSTPKPVYPSFRYIGVESAIDVEATISKDGKVTSARALNGALDVRGPAVRAVQDWRFKPYILDGNPVAVVTTFKFVFKAH